MGSEPEGRLSRTYCAWATCLGLSNKMIHRAAELSSDKWETDPEQATLMGCEGHTQVSRFVGVLFDHASRILIIAQSSEL